jgi:hypothetical protein
MEAARRQGRGGAAGRQRAQRHPPVPARPRPGRRPAAHPDRVGRAVPRRHRASLAEVTPRTRCGTRRGRWAQDHHRLGHADEQGARGHRGALAVRRGRRPHRRGRASAVGRALDGRASWTARSSRSSASPTCGCRSSTPSRIPSAGPRRCPPLDLVRAGRLDFEPPDTERFPCLALAFRALRGGSGPADRAERGQRGCRICFSRGPDRLPGIPAHPRGHGCLRTGGAHRSGLWRTCGRGLGKGFRGRLGGTIQAADFHRHGFSGGRLAIRGNPADSAYPNHQRLAELDVDSRVHFCARRAHFRARARPFPHGAADRRAGAHVFTRLRPQDPVVQAGRHRVLRQRDPPRRLREDGRREPEDNRTGARTSSCRRPSGSASRC